MPEYDQGSNEGAPLDERALAPLPPGQAPPADEIEQLDTRVVELAEEPSSVVPERPLKQHIWIVRQIGKLAFWNKERWKAREPQAGDMSRRSMLGHSLAGAALAFVAANLGPLGKIVGNVRKKGEQVQRLLSFKERFDAKMAALPSDEDIKAEVPHLGATIDLDAHQEARGTTGQPLNVRMVGVGTSNTYACGTDNLDHPTVQEHAAPYRAAQALGDDVKEHLGLGTVETLVVARPGAYSGEQFPGISDEDQPRDGILFQLRSEEVRNFIMESGKDDLVIVRYEGGQDDLRLLADNIDHVERILSNLREALTNTDTVAEDIERELKEFEAKLNELAAQFNANLQEAGRIVAELSRERVVLGMSPVVFQPVYSWSLFEQDRIPFGLLRREDTEAPPPPWLKVDLTDPRFPRWFIEVGEIEEGHNLARWAWATLTQAQTAAVKQIMVDHSDLPILPEWLVGVNHDERFYAVMVNGERDAKGDGHPGLIDGDVSGIDFIAARILDLWTRYKPELGRITAGDYAVFSGQRPRRRPNDGVGT